MNDSIQKFKLEEKVQILPGHLGAGYKGVIERLYYDRYKKGIAQVKIKSNSQIIHVWVPYLEKIT